jgi:hypothetical protein
MAQSQVQKRLNIAGNAVIHATRLVDALLALEQLKEERLQAGNFLDSDFDGTDLNHLTPYMIGTLLDTVVPALVATYAVPTNHDILLQVRK